MVKKKDLTEYELSPCFCLVPEARVELARAQGPLDFESSASTSFTTPASERDDYSDAWFAVSMLIGIEQRAWSRGKYSGQLAASSRQKKTRD